MTLVARKTVDCWLVNMSIKAPIRYISVSGRIFSIYVFIVLPLQFLKLIVNRLTGVPFRLTLVDTKCSPHFSHSVSR